MEKGYLYVHNLAFSKKQVAVLTLADAACGTKLHTPLTKSAKISWFTDRNINFRLSAYKYKTSSSIPEHQQFLTINAVNAHQKEKEVLESESLGMHCMDKKDQEQDIKRDYCDEPEQKRKFIYGAGLLRWTDIGICDLNIEKNINPPTYHGPTLLF